MEISAGLCLYYCTAIIKDQLVAHRRALTYQDLDGTIRITNKFPTLKPKPSSPQSQAPNHRLQNFDSDLQHLDFLPTFHRQGAVELSNKTQMITYISRRTWADVSRPSQHPKHFCTTHLDLETPILTLISSPPLTRRVLLSSC